MHNNKKNRRDSYSLLSNNKPTENNGKDMDNENNESKEMDKKRRDLLLTTYATTMGCFAISSNSQVLAETDPPSLFNTLFSSKKSSPNTRYLVTPKKSLSSDSLLRETLKVPEYRSSETCLLELLPVNNKFFRFLEKSVLNLSTLRSYSVADYEPWKKAVGTMNFTLDELDKKRTTLAPVFNQDDDTLVTITKNERGEKLIESFRNKLVELVTATNTRNATKTFQLQKDALLILSDIGELLVAKYPYEVPNEGKFSYLPRLLGRTKVTFTFRRKNTILGNVTIVADGFAAPLTAGNFVDLSIRNFYTGLPMKVARKKLGGESDFEVASIPVLGSYQEGFYDPLTAKPRTIPLEIILIEQGSQKLSYATEDILSSKSTSPNLLGITGSSSWTSSLVESSTTAASTIMKKTKAPTSTTNAASPPPTAEQKPLLSFEIPGLIALNHPEKNVNGGSSEFIGLQKDSLLDSKRKLLDGEYAPFGYIVDGYDVFEQLKVNDIIDDTHVDEWGKNYLVKLRQSSFSEVVGSSEESAEENNNSNSTTTSTASSSSGGVDAPSNNSTQTTTTGKTSDEKVASK